MTVSGLGNYATIHDCIIKSEYYGNKWEIEDNGNIVNKESNLALNAGSGYSWSYLNVEQKSYSSSQGWSLSNSTKPIVTPIIIGYKSMCLQASHYNGVHLSRCRDQSVQQWAIYPDGTVRPSMSTANCLVSKYFPNGKIAVQDVCDGGNGERWLFNHDRSVSDVSNKYVLEVRKDQRIAVVERSADTPTTRQIFDIKFV